MRSHAKAPTAASTQRQAPGLGRTRFAPTAVLAVAIASLLAFAATPASASLLRNHESSFGSFSGQSPQTMTVDQSNGDIYTFSNNNTVSRFNSAGGAKNFTAGPDAGTNTLTGIGSEGSGTNEIAIDNSGGPGEGTIYVADFSNGVVKAFQNDGTPLASLNGSSTPAGAFALPCGVAVDQSNGDVYVGQYENVISRYSPSGGQAEEADYSGAIATAINPCEVAVASGSLYALHHSEGPLNKYPVSAFEDVDPLPSPSSTFVDSKATAVATDPGNGDVYVDEGNQIAVFSSSGSPKYSFGAGDFGSASFGVAVRAGGNAYVSDPTNHQVDVYGPFSAPPPLLETEAATGIKHTKATLHGHLDPNNSLPITGCVFEWGTDTSYGEAPVPCAEGSSFSAPADVSADLTGLTPGTTYHFRLHLTTGAGGFDGEDQSFETIPPSSVPEVTTGKGSILTATSAELKGTVNPNANPLTDCHFEYVTDLALQATGFSDLSSGGSVPCNQAPGSIPADFEDHEVSATVSGLDPEQVYHFRLVAENANGPGSGADALVPGPPLVETTGSTYRTTTTARLDSRVSSHGAATTYRFEYVTDAQFQASGFGAAASTPEAPFEVDEVQDVAVLGGSGDRFKFSFGGYTSPELTKPVSADQMQAALRALPSIGSPNVRVVAVNEEQFESIYTVVFQGALANTDVDQLLVIPGTPAISQARIRTTVPGGGDHIAFVSADVAGLQPDTTYHYRIVADNGTPGGPIFGAEANLTTRVSDAPLGHGHLAGPPGSDRAWEQVNVPDTGGNPVNNQVAAISDNGERVIYTLEGGSPGSQVGSYNNQLLAERTSGGWQARSIYPTRAEATANAWFPPTALSDLSQVIAVNYDTSSSGPTDVWRLSPGAPAQRVFTAPAEDFLHGISAVSDDGSRIVVRLNGSPDSDHPVTSPYPYDANLYDVTSGTPRLISLLPDGSVPDCGAPSEDFGGRRAEHWVSADGSRVFFLSGGNGTCSSEQLYVRDLEAETTAQISSGSEVKFIRSTADAAFFTTTTSLVPEDEGGRDVYRYDLADESLDCLTCFPGLITDIGGEDWRSFAVSEDGARLYFSSHQRLIPGAAPGIYRVDVASGELAYVAPVNLGDWTGDDPGHGNAISADGSIFIFRSAAPGLNSLNGPQNDLTPQYYRYDDDDRSLVCVSCPADGSPPRGGVIRGLVSAGIEKSPNLTPLSSAGDFAFVAPTALVPADQDTAGAGQAPEAGTDVYEWRDGRLLLVTDGLTATQGAVPEVAGVTPSGRDVFFRQAAQLTPDAIDAYMRLYDARIGGGFEFPAPPPPCPLEACQGTPKGAPEEPRPGSLDFSGAGNQASTPARCRKGKVRRRGRCVAKHHGRKHAKHRANHDRRATR